MDVMKNQAQTALTLNLDQITKFIYCLDEPLGEQPHKLVCNHLKLG
jgi:hypothetical protein